MTVQPFNRYQKASPEMIELPHKAGYVEPSAVLAVVIEYDESATPRKPVAVLIELATGYSLRVPSSRPYADARKIAGEIVQAMAARQPPARFA